MTPELLKQTEQREGRRNRGYKCTAGFWTIGVGHNVESGPPIPDSAIDLILESDLRITIDEINRRWPWATQLDPARHGVLVDLAINMGIQGLAGFVNTLEYIRTQQWVLAAKNLLNSRYAGQVPNRANQNASQLLTGSWQ